MAKFMGNSAGQQDYTDGNPPVEQLEPEQEYDNEDQVIAVWHIASAQVYTLSNSFTVSL